MAQTTQTTKRTNPVLEILAQREAAIFIALILISVLIAIMAPQFRTAKNLYLISRQISFVAIVALAAIAGITITVVGLPEER